MMWPIRHFMLSLLLMAAAFVDVTSAVTIEQIEQAWKSHTEKIRSLDCRYEQEITETVGNDPFGFGEGAKDDSPERLVTQQRTVQLLLEAAERFALRSEGERWHGEKQDVVIRNSYWASNGRQSSTLLDGPGIAMPIGEVFIPPREPGESVFNNTWYQALVLSIKPVEQLRSADHTLKAMTLDENACLYEGAECKLLRIPRSNGEFSEITVDPRVDYLPVRFVALVRGKPYYRHVLTYQEDPEAGWILAKSQTELYAGANQKIHCSIRNRLKAIEVNRDVPDESFAIKFPVGTHIGKFIDGERTFFIQRQPNVQVEISDDEVGVVEPVIVGSSQLNRY